ncbi:hypothetical protein M6B38_261785 [Iris pallida]|uniref:Uncharacterized protein n=1 Tax=Iris pallida TaxID=29817 RepID=A0AAX6ID90_IRIPA|nr:hypothetical protein M6B38_261785 [Iris pallida]
MIPWINILVVRYRSSFEWSSCEKELIFAIFVFLIDLYLKFVICFLLYFFILFSRCILVSIVQLEFQFYNSIKVTLFTMFNFIFALLFLSNKIKYVGRIG